MVERSTRIECRSEPAELWRILADTERFNREAGLPPMEIRPEPEAGGAARYVVKSHLGPFPAEWHEQPFEWVENERYGVRRVMISGPIEWLEVGVHLTNREGGGTDVDYRMALEPRGTAMSLIVGPVLGAVLQKIETAIRRIDERLAAGAPPAIVDGVDEQALGAARTQLEKGAPERTKALIPKLLGWVRTTPDHAARRLRPFELADEWDVPRRDVLELCLAGVVAGLLELSWNVICPSCRTAAARMPRLSELGESGHCDLCDLSYGVELDRAVEAVFLPAPAVREVPDVQYCSGGPAMMPHVLSQIVLSAGGRGSVDVPAEERMRLFARGGAVASVRVAEGAPDSVTVTLGDAFEPATIEVAPDGKIEITDQTGAARHVKLERLGWASLAATAFEVSTLPTYRRVFSGEVLRQGATMRIGRAALLFSDLSASTQLYTREGDAAAFRLVQDHFDLLLGAIGASDGAVVKTIGDAVMAAFVDDVSAVRAGLRMLRAWPEFVADRPEADGVALKIGVFSGACYAYTANGVLDYFGQTVNIAARLQGQADKSEIVVPADLADRLKGLEGFEDVRFGEPYPASLKGIDEAIDAVRLSLT